MLEEAPYDLTEMAFNTQKDEKLIVKIELHPRINQEESAKEGRPIYKEVPYITIMAPGDKHSIVHRPIWEQDKKRFPKHWQAFANKQAQPETGTPLEMWPAVNRAQVLELAYFHIRTVENLANMADNVAMKFMGGMSLKQKAIDWLTASKDTAHITYLRNEDEKKSSQIAVLTRANVDLLERLEKLEAAQLAVAEG